MENPKKTENYTNQGAVNSPPRNCLIVNDYFLRSTTVAFMRLPWECHRDNRIGRAEVSHYMAAHHRRDGRKSVRC
jgi:hypothetical protein